MITVLFGPGGSGKSYYQMRLIHNEIAHGVRNVSTSLAIDLPAYQAYCDKNGLSVSVASRIRILTPEEGKEFWKYRGPDRWSPTEVYEVYRDPGSRGTLFVLDEAGVMGFDSKGWAAKHGTSSRGEACSWYLDQQRKFGDDVYCSVNGTHPHGIAKPIRDKAHNFVQLRNGYQRQMGIFRARGRFEARWYAMEPTSQSEPWRTENWELDTTGLAGCYHTEDGVGIKGAAADKGVRAKGIPVLWAFPMAIAAASLIFVIPWVLSRFSKRATHKSSSAISHVVGGSDSSKSLPGADSVVDGEDRNVTISGVAWDERGRITVGVPGVGWLRALGQDGALMLLEGGYTAKLADVLRGQSPARAEAVRSLPSSGGGLLGAASRALTVPELLDKTSGSSPVGGNSSGQRQGSTAPASRARR